MTLANKSTDTLPLDRTTKRKLGFFSSAPNELLSGLKEIESAFPHRFSHSTETWRIEFRQTAGEKPCFRIDTDSGKIQISYSEPAAGFRALGVLMGQLESVQNPVFHAESSSFETIGVMLDVSRNGVLRMESVHKFIRHFALMGINRLMLYTEDTFEIPSEPAFGYFRGGYTQNDLREIDRYAAHFGIEVIPCIQTLGHLEQVLQWPQYQFLKDTDSVLLSGDPRVNEFVEKMITAASAPFRSNRIHIGMDEAHGIGSGIYRLKNGLRPPFEILCEHLRKTVDTCERHGLKPMIWSDMFFRLGSATNHYYDRESVIAPEIAQQIPDSVQLVYWDYYHSDSEFYDEWIERHRQLGKKPVFAGGIWTWNRFWAHLPYSITTLKAGMQAAKHQELDEAFVTMWGDDGMECDIFSVLPAIQVFADLAYGDDNSDTVHHESNFLGSVDGSFGLWLEGSGLDMLQADSMSEYEANASKWIFWHDPLLGHLEQQILPEYHSQFQLTAETLRRSPQKHPEDKRIEFVSQVATAMTLKTELHLKLRRAYQDDDRQTLQGLYMETLPSLMEAIDHLFAIHEALWHESFRFQGWDVLERRYAGLTARLNRLQRKLDNYLDRRINCIEELESQPIALWPHKHTKCLTISHRQAVTPTTIF